MLSQYNKDFQLWCTSHLSLDEMKTQYEFSENEHLKLYYTKEHKELKNIDKYAWEFGGFVAMYYVWKNQLKSNIVGFCEYRRHYNLNMIDLERIKRGEIQTYEGQIGFYHPRTQRHNSVIEWSFMFKYPTYIIYEFAKILSKHFNKPLNDIFKDLSDVEFFKDAPGRQMFICNWEIFDKMMTIYDDFLNAIMPNYDIDDNFEKYWEIETLLFDQKLSIGDLKNDSEQNFYHINEDESIWYNRRIPAYYGETFLGVILIYLSNNKIFQNTYNYYINVDELIDENGNISDQNKNIIFDYYIKSLCKGVREFRIYSYYDKTIDLGNYSYEKFNKLGIIPKCWAYDYYNWKQKYQIDDKYYEENVFLKYDKNTNTFILNNDIK